MPYLLDTNAWIEYFKQPTNPIQAKLSLLRPADVVSCSVVKSELLHGAEKYANRDRRQRLVIETLAPFRSIPIDDDAAVIYARIRHELEVVGQVIGPYDLQIAAICLRHGFTLVTSNVGEFSRIAGLNVEDWLHI
jgi:tRNA(fMet)-specific endonuclease VapC